MSGAEAEAIVRQEDVSVSDAIEGTVGVTSTEHLEGIILGFSFEETGTPGHSDLDDSLTDQVIIAPNGTIAINGPRRSHNRFRRVAATAATGGVAMLAAGCGGKVVDVVTGPTGGEPAQAATANVNTACGAPLDLAANRADSLRNVGSTESVFQKLNNVDTSGNQILVHTDTARKAVQEQLLGDVRVLGLFTAYFIETRAHKQEPDTATLARAEQLMSYFANNPQAAADAAAYACSQVSKYLEPKPDFSISANQAVAVEADHAGNHISRIHYAELHTSETMQGFVLGFNPDDRGLSKSDKALYDKLKNLILISSDGEIIINKLIGNGSGGFNIVETSKNTAPAHIKIDAHGQPMLVIPRSALLKASGSGGSTGSGESSGQQKQSLPGVSTSPNVTTSPIGGRPKKVHSTPSGGTPRTTTTISTVTPPPRTTTTPTPNTTTSPPNTTTTFTTTTTTPNTITTTTTPTTNTTTTTTPKGGVGCDINVRSC